MSFLLIVLVLVTLPIGVWGTVTAVYTPESQIVFQVAPGPFTHNTVLGAKLGTFVFTSTTGVIYNPAMVHIAEASGATPVTGLMRDSLSPKDGFYNTSCDFYIICVSYPNGLGAEPVLKVLYNDVTPIIDNTYTVYQSTFYVELYLINGNTFINRHSSSGWRPSTLFKHGTPYSLPSNFNPIFSVAVASESRYNVGWYTSGSVVNPQLGSYADTTGQGGSEGTHIIGPGAYTDPNNPGSPGFNYGDPPSQPTQPDFEFWFRDENVNFDISDAYDSNRVVLNAAKMNVVNGESGKTYIQYLTFTDSGFDNSFQLKPYGVNGDNVDFQLFFGNDPNAIPYGEPIPWSGLAPGMNERDLKIGQILPDQVNQRVSGAYTDTITVNITAGDN